MSLENINQRTFAWCLFTQMRDILGNINNIKCLETSLYSDTMGIGSSGLYRKYKGKLSVIDFKTSSKERQDSYNETTTYKPVYSYMFEERTGQKEQCVILVVTQDGTVQEFIKQRDDYTTLLNDAIEEWNKRS